MNTEKMREAAKSKATEMMETEDMYNYPQDGLEAAFADGAYWQAAQQPAPTVSSKILEGEWAFCQTISDGEEVDAAMRNFIEEASNDSGVYLVRAVLRAAVAARPQPAPADQREVMQQAYDFIAKDQPNMSYKQWENAMPILDALRQALAAPPLPQAAPVPEGANCGLSWNGFNIFGNRKSVDEVKAAIHAKDSTVPSLRQTILDERAAAPRAPARLPLDAARVLQIWDQYVCDPTEEYPLTRMDVLRFAAAIEAAHSIHPATPTSTTKD